MIVYFLHGGNTAVFDEAGQQIPGLQESWLATYLHFLEEHDVDPVEVEFVLPDGETVRPFRTEQGWNWEAER